MNTQSPHTPPAGQNLEAHTSASVMQGRKGNTDRAGQGELHGFWPRMLRFLGMRGKFDGLLRSHLEDKLSRESDDVDGFSPEERELIGNILRLRELRVDDIMVPLADIDAIDQNASLSEVIRLFGECGHSRMPVYDKTLDDPRGFIHIKDLLLLFQPGSAARPGDAPQNGRPGQDAIDLDAPLARFDIARALIYAPPSMPASELMARMRANRIQLALVIDEYGGTDGLVSLEDLVETVVGDIEDEHDEAEGPMIEKIGENMWIADARAQIEDMSEILGTIPQTEEMTDDIDTLGGLIFNSLGRVPVRGEMTTFPQMPGIEFEILDADPRRIKRLRIFQKQIRARAAGRPALPAGGHPGSQGKAV